MGRSCRAVSRAWTGTHKGCMSLVVWVQETTQEGKGETEGEATMKEWARWFYLSKSWIQTRNAYMSSKYGMCERCTRPAEIVHHKIWLTRHNINDPNITLNWNNLEALCRTCHAIEHEGLAPTANGLKFDEAGNIMLTPPIK